MKNSALFRSLLLGFLIFSLLGLASFFGLRSLNESSTVEVRRHMTLFIAQAIENGPYTQTVQEYHPRGRRNAGSNLWVFSSDGKILASNSENPPSVSWAQLKKPANPHEFSFYYRTFRLLPDLTLIKLDSTNPANPPGAFLLIENLRAPPSAFGTAWIYIAFFLFVIGVAVFIAFSMIYLYLKEQSRKAREVLGRLEKGDLQARFEIKRIDEIGSLMHDFNRMASEIERLVHRVQETENTRKNLLSELSHDIRTPLTSLKTSIETLSDHFDVMPKEEQKEFIAVSRAELTYFLGLIDDLFFIADLGEPRYKKTAQKIDIVSLLGEETKSRQKTEPRIQWLLDYNKNAEQDATLLGDPLLIQRLIRNVLDNAGKHARSIVKLRFFVISGDLIGIEVSDDGPGISDEAIALFGQRRKQRISASESKQGASLGLGSVIMKTILELHGGELKITRSSGTIVLITLPRDHID